MGFLDRCWRLTRRREDMGPARGRGPWQLASLGGPTVSTLTGGRETVAGRDGHLTRVVKRSPAQANFNILTRTVVVLSRLVERLVGHVGHLLTCVPSRYFNNQTRGSSKTANICLVNVYSTPYLVVHRQQITQDIVDKMLSDVESWRCCRIERTSHLKILRNIGSLIIGKTAELFGAPHFAFAKRNY